TSRPSRVGRAPRPAPEASRLADSEDGRRPLARRAGRGHSRLPPETAPGGFTRLDSMIDRAWWWCSEMPESCALRSDRPKHPGRKFEARYTLYLCHPRLVSGYKLGTNIKGSSYF